MSRRYDLEGWMLNGDFWNKKGPAFCSWGRKKEHVISSLSLLCTERPSYLLGCTLLHPYSNITNPHNGLRSISATDFSKPPLQPPEFRHFTAYSVNLPVSGLVFLRSKLEGNKGLFLCFAIIPCGFLFIWSGILIFSSFRVIDYSCLVAERVEENERKLWVSAIEAGLGDPFFFVDNSSFFPLWVSIHRGRVFFFSWNFPCLVAEKMEENERKLWVFCNCCRRGCQGRLYLTLRGFTHII